MLERKPRPANAVHLVLSAALTFALTLALLAPRPSVADNARWQVDNPPGKHRKINIDTRRGTWMSVSVRPDGKALVFDLLGDIYSLPIAGGEAKALTSGMAWDMQPTFSPDGRHIAFTSDRKGGDNIFIMAADGKGVRPLTSEKFRLLTQPVWTPDGRFVAARKHFSSRRSLGSGEIWMYYETGGKGVQMTVKKSLQKDLGEPAFSPDGRWLYYSHDASPGKRFQYAKDPNPQIFAIDRVDRKSGRVERFLGGPGGATRPTPSPDGKRLAYLRRVRAHTVLYVRDLRSGEEKALYNALDRDLQETWSIHGTYPAMSWLPDGKSLVVWAHGELLRAWLDGRVTKIPFHVKTTRKVSEPLRFATKVAPAKVALKMLRWVRVSPDGTRVVFEALGKLWIRPVGGGKAKRLTKQDAHFELMPSWSRDGKRIAYTTWSDTDLGAVRVVSSGGGNGKVVSERPGHYVEPAWSPDGKALVVRRSGGGWLRSARWSTDRGLWWLPLGKGKARRLSFVGAHPHFGADPGRVYYVRRDAGKKGGKEKDLRQRLESVALSDKRVRVHGVGPWWTSARVSPDGRWLAFTERFHVFVMPFAATARPFVIKHDNKSWPTIRVSTDAGDFLHWSGDSEAVHWALGPRLFTRTVEGAYRILRDDPTADPKGGDKGDGEAAKSTKKPLSASAKKRAMGVKLGFDVPAATHKASAAIVGARIVTMNGDEVLADGTIVWRAGRITAVGPRADVKVPAAAKVFDGKGLTVLPGFVDAHAHGAQATSGITPQQNWGNLSLLSFGVTTIHDPSNRTQDIFAASQLQRAGVILAPRLFSTGTILYGARHFFTAHVDSLADARRHLRRMKAVGAISVKSYNQPRREQRQQLVAAARELKMMVVPEGGAVFMHNMTQVVDGHTGVEHALPIARAYDDVVQLWSSTPVGYTPTLGVAYGGLGGEWYWYAKTRVDKNKRLGAFVPPFAIDPRARRRKEAPDEEWNHINAARFATRLQRAGTRVNLGAHGQREGLAVHWELWSFVQGGMKPLEAIRSCTRNPAWYLGLDGDIGSLQPGKLADMMVVDGNPLKDIRQSEKVKWTVLGGRVYESATMNALHPKARKRPQLFWKRGGEPRATARIYGQHVGCGCGLH